MHTISGIVATALAAVTLGACSVTGGDLVRPGAPTATLVVENGSGGYIDAVVISECSNFTYGFNRLPDGYSIPPGGRYSFTLSAGCWDVGGGEFAGGEAYERMTLTPEMVMTYTITD